MVLRCWRLRYTGCQQGEAITLVYEVGWRVAWHISFVFVRNEGFSLRKAKSSNTLDDDN